jgi:hypothetical protein
VGGKAKQKPKSKSKTGQQDQQHLVLHYWEDILKRLREGETLTGICRTAGYPSAGAVRYWVGREEALYSAYARARELGYQGMADQLLDIADQSSKESWSRDQLRLSTRQWLLSKALPRMYGDRVQVSGGDDGPIRIAFVAPESESEVESEVE